MTKKALVTGASRGIGRAIAGRLASQGYDLYLTCLHSMDSLTEYAHQLTERYHISCFPFQGDMGCAADVERLFSSAPIRSLDVLVNNAGVAPNVRADLLEMSEESFDRVLRINLKGNMFLTQAAAKQMMRQPLEGKKRGTIVNISSCSAEVVSVNRGEYCVSKAGISMLTQLYAARLAPEQILVHEVRPGVIRTDMTKGVGEKYDRLIQEGRFPIARWGEPEDVADAVSALCSDKFLYTTGDVIDVDGGFHIKQL